MRAQLLFAKGKVLPFRHAAGWQSHGAQTKGQRGVGDRLTKGQEAEKVTGREAAAGSAGSGGGGRARLTARAVAARVPPPPPPPRRLTSLDNMHRS